MISNLYRVFVATPVADSNVLIDLAVRSFFRSLPHIGWRDGLLKYRARHLGHRRDLHFISVIHQRSCESQTIDILRLESARSRFTNMSDFSACGFHWSSSSHPLVGVSATKSGSRSLERRWERSWRS